MEEEEQTQHWNSHQFPNGLSEKEALAGNNALCQIPGRTSRRAEFFPGNEIHRS